MMIDDKTSSDESRYITVNMAINFRQI